MDRVLGFLATLILGVTLTTSGTRADTVTFDLRADAIEDIDEVASFTLFDLSSGIAATLTANSGVLNRTASAFGINAEGTGDDTDTIDGVLVAEHVTIVFNQAVTFDALQLSLYTPSAGDLAALKIGSNPVVHPVPQTSAIDTYSFTTANYVGPGETVVLGWVEANGFSFDNFTVSAVPEPGTLALLCVAAVGYGLCRRRKSA
jgi:hypothetical protein